MSVWCRLRSHSGGYESLLDEAIAIVDGADPQFLLPMDQGRQFLVSDYSGQHRQATHEVHSFLITTYEAVQAWLPFRDRFREQWLPDGRRLSFKQLREPMRRRAYPHFLSLAGRLPGNLMTFMIDRRIGSFVEGGPRALVEALDDCFVEGTADATVEKIYRLALLVALLQAGLRDEGQPSLWISDHDETLDSYERREGLGRLASYLTFGFTGWRNPADQDFMTTEAEGLPSWVEDLAAIPDIAAGASAQLSTTIPLFEGQRTWTVRRSSDSHPDWRARGFADSLSDPAGVLRHALIRLAPDDKGEIRASAQRFVRRTV